MGQAGLGPDVVLSWPSGQSWFRAAGLTAREVIATVGTETQTWGQSHTWGHHAGSEGDTMDRLQASRGTGCHHSHRDAAQSHRVLGDRKEVGGSGGSLPEEGRSLHPQWTAG